MQRVWLFLLLLATFVSSSLGATRTVCATGATYTTIQAAINAASAGDTISICDGTYNERDIKITKDNLTILGASGNRNNVIVNRSGDPIFVIQAANATIKNLTIVSSTYGIRDNYQASGSHTFENLAFNTSNTSIYLSNDASACTFKNLSITSNYSGIYLAWNIDGSHIFQDITISAQYTYGIYAARGAGTFSNVTITSGSTGIHLGSKYLATFDTISVKNSAGYGINLNSSENYSHNHTFSNLSIDSPDTGLYVERGGKVTVKDSTIASSAGYGIYFAWDVNGAHEFSNIAITSYNTGIYCLSGLGLVEDFTISNRAGYGIHAPNYHTTTIHRGTIASHLTSIYISSGSSKAVTLEDLTLSSQAESGIYLTACSSAFINRVCVSKALYYGIYTAWDANSVTISNSKIEGNTGYGISINSNSNSGSKATVTNNCLLKSPFAYRNNAAHDFRGNYWNGTPPSGYDPVSTRLSSCPVTSCYVPNPSSTTPILDYRMDDCAWSGVSGEVKDNSSNNLHATAINSDSSSLQSGVMNNAGDFNRTKSQYIQLPALTTDKVNFNDGFTVTAWARFSTTAGSWERIFDFGNGTDVNNIFLGREDTSNNLILGIHDSTGGDTYLRANGAISDTNWHLWALTCSGSTCTLYKDGTVLSSSSTMKIPSNIQRTSNYIGKSNWSNDAYFQGRMDEFKVFDQVLNTTQIQAIYANELAKKNYDGTQRDEVTCSACEVLADGYHIINPFGNTEKKFEIYCQNKKNYLMLPFYNAIAPNSNFLFTSTPIDNNYYNASNVKKAIKMLEVTFDTQNTRLKIKKIIYEDASEGYDFSNLNLIGTPFSFVNPRDTSTIKQCSADNTSRLRVGMNQVLKINPRASGYARACVIEEPSLRFLSDYKFLEFDGTESLFLDCANLASNTTTEQILEVTGSFFIDPKRVGRNHTQRDRPFVASCKYQSDLNQAWTFVLALDGYTTTTKNDATNKTDTCSKLGLTFFIPNSKTTFGRVRQFLFDSQPSEWGNYVGTVQEYFTDNAITGWATDDQVSELKPNPVPNGLMWPYGPMGIYRPLDGNGGSNDKKMPKSPQYLSTAEINAGFGSMQETGWRSLYYDYHGDGNLTKDLWWVADIAAGYRADLTAQNPKPVEPNGDYDANNWLGWFTDVNGNVVHYNDQNTVNGQYRYSNYMCMSYANIDEIVRYQPVFGAFDIIDRSVASGQEINNRYIQTKIANAPILLDMIILKDDESALQPDKNISVGVFLNDIEMVGNLETPRDISYIGDIKRDNTGSLSNHKPTGRFSLPSLSRSSANQKLFFKFKYCNRNDFEWTDCWTRSGNSATCKPEQALQCKSVDSDYFAVRPDKFGISIAGVSPNLLKAGEDYNVSIIAQEYNSATPTAGYNQSKSNLTIQNPPAKLFRDGTIDSNNTLQGILTVGAANYDFINGTTNEMTINFTDVGRISFDINDSEWAKIDITDTAEINRTIQGDVNVTFIPYRFTVSGVRITNTQDGNFTYISNDLNMSAHLDFTITAQNKQGNPTQNFSSGLYENNISITPSIIDDTYGDANESNVSTLSLGFTSGTKHIAWNETNTSQNIYFNFTRPTLPINPFDVNNSEVNLSIASSYTDAGTTVAVENNTTNKNGLTNGTLGSATFYYGRVHAPDQRFDGTNGTANIYYEVYCRNCTSAFRTSMGVTGNESVDAINWYQNSLHVNNTFGEFNSTAPTATSSGLTLGTRTLYEQNLTAPSTPHVNRINFGSSSWLRYYPEYFNVSFTRTGSQWAGEGSVERNETGNVGKFTNDRNVTRSQRRLNW